jgi:hypothetical protein
MGRLPKLFERRLMFHSRDRPALKKVIRVPLANVLSHNIPGEFSRRNQAKETNQSCISEKGDRII